LHIHTEFASQRPFEALQEVAIMMTIAVGSARVWWMSPIGFNAIQQRCRGGSLLLRIVATQSSPTGIAGYIPENVLQLHDFKWLGGPALPKLRLG
jgi:hypothetical protein